MAFQKQLYYLGSLGDTDYYFDKIGHVYAAVPDYNSGQLGSWFSKLFHQITKKPFTALAHIAAAPFTAGASLAPNFFKGLKPALKAVETVAPAAAAIVAAPFVLPALGITTAGGALTAATTAQGAVKSVEQMQAAKKQAAEQQAQEQQAQQEAAQAQEAQQVAQDIQTATDTGQPITPELSTRAAKLGIKIAPTQAVPTEAGIMGIGNIPTSYVVGAGVAVVIGYLLFSKNK